MSEAQGLQKSSQCADVVLMSTKKAVSVRTLNKYISGNAFAAFEAEYVDIMQAFSSCFCSGSKKRGSFPHPPPCGSRGFTFSVHVSLAQELVLLAFVIRASIKRVFFVLASFLARSMGGS